MEDRGKTIVEEKGASSIITYDSCIGHNCLQYNLHPNLNMIRPSHLQITKLLRSHVRLFVTERPKTSGRNH